MILQKHTVYFFSFTNINLKFGVVVAGTDQQHNNIFIQSFVNTILR